MRAQLFATAVIAATYATEAASAPTRVWRCHMNTCSWFSVVSKETAGKGPAGTLVRVAARFGEGPQEGKPRVDQPLNISHVFCSRTVPGYLAKEGGTWNFTPIYPHQVFGVSVGIVTFYFRVCHDTNAGWGANEIAAKLGYKVAEDRSAFHLRDPRELLALTSGDAADRSERAKVDRLLAENSSISATTFRARWRSLIGRTVSVAHCTIHDVEPNAARALCAILDGAKPAADIRLRFAPASPPPLDCSGPTLSTKCTVIVTGTVINEGGEAALTGATTSQ